MGLLPSKPDLSADSDAGPRVVGVDSEDADDLMSALTSQTARRLLSTLHEEPAPPSRLADQVDTSLQNVQYHLERLEEAGAVEVVGTAYSEKGREMDLYAPAAEPLVIYAGREEEASGLRAALSRLVSGIVALAVGAVAIQEVFGDGLPFPVARTGSGGDAGGAGDASAGGGGSSADGGETGDTSSAGGGGGGGAGDGGSAGTPEPTTASGGDGIGIAEAPTRTPTSTAESGAGTATPAPTGAAETPSGTPAPTGEPTGTSTSVATETPVAEGTPSPIATESATPVPTEAATPVPTVEPTPAATATDVATEAVRTVASAGGAPDPAALPPGLVFFLGGAVVLVAGVALMYGR